MRELNGASFATLSLVALTAMVAGACGSDKIITKTVEVPVEAPLFEPPPATALSFLGYDNEATKLTVCGNCHIGQQSEWQGTAHADAWATLQNSGGAQGFCENCHTDGPNGNSKIDGGWAATANARYHDVQCENCHGPGETHVMNPDATANRPLASAKVGVDLSSGCGECHSGNHHPFVDQWSQSAHSQVVGFAADREECQACHRGQATLEAWGVKANYIEKNSAEHLPVTCAVCHDPHDATNEGQLRFPVNTTSIENHLCARCHNRRTIPDPTSAHGLAPHAPESELLVGNAGWFPPNSQIDQGQILGTHGGNANPKLCATCHVSQFTVTDQVTGDFVFNSTGHLFEAIPCLDPTTGIPTAGDCGVNTTERSFQSCTAAGCHGTEDAAFSALTVASQRIQGDLATLENLLRIVEVVPSPAPFSDVENPGGQIDANDPTFTVAEGAFFNYNLANFGGDVYGSTTHNPFLTEGLLIASIQAVINEYDTIPGVMSVSPGRNWSAELSAVLRKARQ